MICKNCNTAVEDNEEKCPSCGKELNKNSKLPVIAIILVLLAVALLLYFSNRGEADYSDDIISPAIDEAEPNENTGEPNLQAENISQEIPEEDSPIDISEADLEKDIDEVWEMLDIALISINQYFDKYGETVAYASRNGYLYEIPSQSYVLASDLLDLTDFPVEYEDESILFLYIRPADLKEYLGRNVEDSTDLAIFVAYETKEGFALTAKWNAGGIIPREDLQKVLENYKWNNGPIRKVAYDSDEFLEALDVISRYENYEGGYDVRYMYRDDKYITVVLSKEGAHKVLQEYVLEDLEEVLVMRAGNIQDSDNYKVYANTIIPDYNLAMLPDYNISEFSKYITDGFDEVVNQMISSNIISEDDLPVTFETGAMEFIYLEFASGEHYMGYLYGGTWEMTLVEDYDMVIEYMSYQTRKPPYFILKQY